MQLRDYYESGNLVVSKIESELQLADLLTKALDPESFARHRNRILSTRGVSNGVDRSSPRH